MKPYFEGLKIWKNQEQRLNYFRGTFWRTKVIVEKVSDDVARESLENFLDLARSIDCPNFLRVHFAFTNSNIGRCFIMKDAYFCTIDMYVKSSSYRIPNYMISAKHLYRDLSSALVYAKKMDMCRFNIQFSTIVIVQHRNGSCTFKISDFTNSVYASESYKIADNGFAHDMNDFQTFLLDLRKRMLYEEENEVEQTIVDLGLNSHILMIDAIKKMTSTTIEKMQKHPFIWNAPDIAALFVKAAKLLEQNDERFLKVLKSAHGVVPRAYRWTEYVGEHINDELDRVLQNKTGNPELFVRDGIVSLVRTIRNMVSCS